MSGSPILFVLRCASAPSRGEHVGGHHGSVSRIIGCLDKGDRGFSGCDIHFNLFEMLGEESLSEYEAFRKNNEGG